MTDHTRNLRDSTLVLVDGTTPTPNELTIVLDNGNLAFTETANVQTIYNRGKIAHRREGDETEMEVSFTIKFVQWSYNAGASDGISVPDALKNRGGAASWESTDASCAPFAVDLQFRIGNPCEEGSDEVLTFPKFTVTSMAFSEGEEFNTIAVTGRSLAATPIRTYEA